MQGHQMHPGGTTETPPDSHTTHNKAHTQPLVVLGCCHHTQHARNHMLRRSAAVGSEQISSVPRKVMSTGTSSTVLLLLLLLVVVVMMSRMQPPGPMHTTHVCTLMLY
jgi:hypothetical protein